MNREIKFRVWTGEEMITPPNITIGVGSAAELIQIDLNGGLSLRNAYGLDGFSKNPTFDDPVKFHLMQHTGMTDAHDVDVYAGDILAIPYITPMGVDSGTEDRDYRAYVEFDNGCFLLKYPNRDSILLYELCNRAAPEYKPNYGTVYTVLNTIKASVIGNIYQNAGLLSK